MEYIWLYIISIAVGLLSLESVNFLYVLLIALTAIYGAKVLAKDIEINYSKIKISIIIVLFLNIFNNFPSFNILSYLIFSIKEVAILYIVFNYTGSEKIFVENNYSFNKSVGIKLLILAEAMKFIVNALMINFNGFILNYFYVVGYGLAIIAIIYLTIVRVDELGKYNDEECYDYDRNIRVDRIIRPGGNRNRK